MRRQEEIEKKIEEETKNITEAISKAMLSISNEHFTGHLSLEQMIDEPEAKGRRERTIALLGKIGRLDALEIEISPLVSYKYDELIEAVLSLYPTLGDIHITHYYEARSEESEGNIDAFENQLIRMLTLAARRLHTLSFETIVNGERNNVAIAHNYQTISLPQYTRAIGSLLCTPNCTLTTLSITDMGLEEKDIQEIACGIKAHSPLLSFSIMQDYFDPTPLLESAATHPSLTALFLQQSTTEQSPAWTFKLEMAIRGCMRNKNLNVLQLSHRLDSKLGTLFDREVLLDNTTLTHLDLSWNNLKENAASLMHILAFSSTVTYLNLSDNKIPAGCVRSLADMLVQNKSLTSIDLSHNLLNLWSESSTYAKFIVEALENNSVLTSLRLVECIQHTDPVIAFLDALPPSTRLSTLVLGHGFDRSVLENERSGGMQDRLCETMQKTLTRHKTLVRGPLLLPFFRWEQRPLLKQLIAQNEQRNKRLTWGWGSVSVLITSMRANSTSAIKNSIIPIVPSITKFL